MIQGEGCATASPVRSASCRRISACVRMCADARSSRCRVWPRLARITSSPTPLNACTICQLSRLTCRAAHFPNAVMRKASIFGQRSMRAAARSRIPNGQKLRKNRGSNPNLRPAQPGYVVKTLISWPRSIRARAIANAWNLPGTTMAIFMAASRSAFDQLQRGAEVRLVIPFVQNALAATLTHSPHFLRMLAEIAQRGGDTAGLHGVAGKPVLRQFRPGEQGRNQERQSARHIVEDFVGRPKQIDQVGVQ